MKKLKSKIVVIMLITILSLLILSTNAFAKTESKEVQVVKAENGDYIVYVKDLIASEGFKFAISDEEGKDPNSTDLNKINSVTDKDNNQVALIQSETVSGKTETNLYIGETETKLDLKNAFTVSDMEEVENTTKRINAELKTDIEQKNEVVDGIQYTVTVGGLEITDSDREKSKYEYVSESVSERLPKDKYSELQELAKQLEKDGNYESKDMYAKIEFAKNFSKLYKELIDIASWKPVQNLTIMQPEDAQKNEKYVVLLKKTAEDGTETYDAKFMTSYRTDKEASIPARTEIKTVKETAKLPVTGDSMILYIVLAVILVALIVVFIRMKKLKNQGKH